MSPPSLRSAGLVLALAAGFGLGRPAAAETGRNPAYLGDVTVTATRVPKPLDKVPAAVGYVGTDEIQFARQQIGIDEGMGRIPGVFMQNRYNFAQDLRISIRGFGARASFGIRGIKLFVDGIPATLPDGQGGVDSIDIGSMDHMEVIRGPASSLYGSASGGVILMFTEDGPTDRPFVELRSSFGSYGFQKYQLKAGGQAGSLNYLASLSRLEYDGYRQHSRTESTLFNGKFRYAFDTTSDLMLAVNALDSPVAEDPGGLKRTADATNVGLDTRRAAQTNNLRFDAGESVEQQQFGLVYHKRVGDAHEFSLRNYYVWRNFNSRLPFGDFSGLGTTPSGGIVGLDRLVVGGGGQYSGKAKLFGHRDRLTLGLDIDKQMDHRVNFTNIIDSSVVGPKSLDQDENVLGWGLYLQNELALGAGLEWTLGARYDRVAYDFKDHYLADGHNDSGSIVFREVSPMTGLLWSFGRAVNLYGNIGTSFETPSSRELANPTAAGGFNQGLKAQRAVNYEVGIKGTPATGANYQIALFRIETDHELILAGQNPAGSDYYTNAGQTVRKGVEAAVSVSPLKGLTTAAAYTWSDFAFQRFTDTSGTSFAGNAIPGIPEHLAYLGVTYYHPSGIYGSWETQWASRVYVDNANSDAAAGYAVSNLRLGYTLDLEPMELTPFAGINNLFDREYIGAVRINEAHGRFFEPAPERNYYAGLSLRIRL